jgi:hypothetical protein
MVTETTIAPAGPGTARVTPNFMAMAFGLAGLGEVWNVAGPVLSLPQAVPDIFLAASAMLWAVLVGLYLAQWRRSAVPGLVPGSRPTPGPGYLP